MYENNDLRHKCYMNEIDRQTERDINYFTQLAWFGQNDSRNVPVDVV